MSVQARQIGVGVIGRGIISTEASHDVVYRRAGMKILLLLLLLLHSPSPLLPRERPSPSPPAEEASRLPPGLPGQAQVVQVVIASCVAGDSRCCKSSLTTTWLVVVPAWRFLRVLVYSKQIHA